MVVVNGGGWFLLYVLVKGGGEVYRKCKRGVDLVEIQNFVKRFSYNTDDGTY